MPPRYSSVFALRWASFVSSIWLMQFSGSYCYSMYSSALKEVLQINQVQLNNLSVAKDLGDALGVVAGVMSNYIAPWALLTVAAAAGLLGYGTQWLVVSRVINPLPYWTMCLAALLAANCVSWINTATFMVSVGNFPRNRGPVVGLFKAYMGLTAAVFSVLCRSLFSNSPSKLLLMLTIIPAAACTLSAFFLRPLPAAYSKEEENEEKQGIFLFNVIAIGLALYLVFLDIYLPNKGAGQKAVMGVLFLILAAPVPVPLYLFFTSTKRAVGVVENRTRFSLVVDGADEECRSEGDGISEPLLQACKKTGPKNGREGPVIAIRDSAHHRILRLGKTWGCLEPLPDLGEDHNTFQLLRSWDFFVLYLTCFCTIGAGATFSNNLGQIGQAIGFKSVTLFASFFSLGNFFGRILSGNASEYFLRKAAIPRSVWMGVAKAPMVATFLWLASGSETALYVGSVVLGLSHGLHFTLMIPLVSELYGLKYFGTNYTVSTTVLLAGSFVFSGMLAGRLYDLEAYRQGRIKLLVEQPLNQHETSTCTGANCYRLIFIILAAVLVAASVLDVLLSARTRKLYRKLQRINTSINATEDS